MNVVPTKATVGIARRMVAETADTGADVVLNYLPDVEPGQVPALVALLAKWASGEPIIVLKAPPTRSTEPAWICTEAIAWAAQHYDITVEELMTGRATPYLDARAVAMSAAHVAGVGYSEAGRRFYRDHSTVMNADRRVRRTSELWIVAERIGNGLRLNDEAVA